MQRTYKNVALDTVDRKIIEVLLADARISIRELASKVKLSPPSVSERMERLQERGIIRRFTVEIDPASLGYELQALVRIKPLPGKVHIVQKLIEDIPEFSECSKVTGNDCFIARLHVFNISQLDGIIDRIARVAELNTSVVKAQPVQNRLPPFLPRNFALHRTAPSEPQRRLGWGWIGRVERKSQQDWGV